MCVSSSAFRAVSTTDEYSKEGAGAAGAGVGAAA